MTPNSSRQRGESARPHGQERRPQRDGETRYTKREESTRDHHVGHVRRQDDVEHPGKQQLQHERRRRDQEQRRLDRGHCPPPRGTDADTTDGGPKLSRQAHAELAMNLTTVPTAIPTALADRSHHPATPTRTRSST